MSQISSDSNPSREGHQIVQIGPEKLAIPKEWTVTTIDEVASRFISGGTPDSDNEDYWGGSIPWTTCAVVEGPQFDGEKDFITKKGLESSSASLVPEGSILFGTRVNVANVGRTTKEIAISQDLTGIVLDEERVDPDFVTWYLLFNQSKIRDRYSQGSTIQGMITSDLKSLPLLLPPLSEQRRIVEVLSKIEEQIQQTNKIIDRTEDIERGLLNDFIPRGISEQGKLRPSPNSNPGLYDEVRRCKIPSGWEVSSLQELCQEDVTYGIVQAGPHVEDGIPYIKTGDMTDGELKLEGLSRTSSEIAEDYSRSEIREGELVIAIRATVGVVHQVPPELDGGNLTQGTARISPDDSIDNRYLLWAIRSNVVQSLIDARTKGSTFNEITLGALRKVPIPHPTSLKEQKKITERLDSASKKLDEERSYMRELKNVKRGLMQDLLTGKVRVNPE
ncbi:restriction endonuclease subunit S [Haloarcula rara]|uniref:restriction endonuclease subunit S n=1 Tax=Haloarcula rara TaxID=3033387 RepID=UPI0023E81163|nr:restriction endonuclease subunit S [Halomicroarcula sp. SHR3]